MCSERSTGLGYQADQKREKTETATNRQEKADTLENSTTHKYGQRSALSMHSIKQRDSKRNSAASHVGKNATYVMREGKNNPTTNIKAPGSASRSPTLFFSSDDLPPKTRKKGGC